MVLFASTTSENDGGRPKFGKRQPIFAGFSYLLTPVRIGLRESLFFVLVFIPRMYLFERMLFVVFYYYFTLLRIFHISDS